MTIELNQVMEALDRVEDKMSETSQSNAAELKRLGEEQLKFSRMLLELQQKGVNVSTKPQEKSVGENFVETDHFKAFRDGSALKARVDIAEGVRS